MDWITTHNLLIHAHRIEIDLALRTREAPPMIIFQSIHQGGGPVKLACSISFFSMLDWP